MKSCPSRSCPLILYFLVLDAALKRRSSTMIFLHDLHDDLSPRLPRLASAFQEVPGFLVFGIFGGFAVWGEEDVGLVVGSSEGEDVPGVGGDYIRGDEVDLVGAVRDVIGCDAADVGVFAFADGAFDLDAAEASAVVSCEVVGGIVSPGLGDAEAEGGGAGHETELRPLAAGFGVADVHSFIFHG